METKILSEKTIAQKISSIFGNDPQNFTTELVKGLNVDLDEMCRPYCQFPEKDAKGNLSYIFKDGSRILQTYYWWSIVPKKCVCGFCSTEGLPKLKCNN